MRIELQTKMTALSSIVGAIAEQSPNYFFEVIVAKKRCRFNDRLASPESRWFCHFTTGKELIR